MRLPKTEAEEAHAAVVANVADYKSAYTAYLSAAGRMKLSQDAWRSALLDDAESKAKARGVFVGRSERGITVGNEAHHVTITAEFTGPDDVLWFTTGFDDDAAQYLRPKGAASFAEAVEAALVLGDALASWREVEVG